MFATGLLLLVLQGVGDAGGPPHPRLLFHQDDLDFLQQNLNHPLYQESWDIVEGFADNPKGPLVNQAYDFTDIPGLYGYTLNIDTDDMFNGAVAYALTGQARYSTLVTDRMDNIVSWIDVSYQSGLNWWDSVLWDVLAVRMVISLDLVWNDLTNTEKSTYATWLDTLCTSVAVLHTKDMNSGYYKSNDCGGNIKSWNNCLFGLTGFLVGDQSWIQYALTDPNNGMTKSGKYIEFNLQSQVRNTIVEEPTGPNSQYGLYRTVDWIRAIDDGQSYNEAIGYQLYHQQALELLLRGALRHGRDYYRMAGRSVGTDGRHHLIDPVERVGDFAALTVPAVDNEWRTWNGSQWYYSANDKYYAGVNGLKLAGFTDEVRSARMDTINQRLDDIINDDLDDNQEYDADFHILRYAWPLTRVWRVKGRPEGGDLVGQVQFETAPPGTPGQLDLVQLDHPELGRVATPVELDADGSYDAYALDPTLYAMLVRAPGHQSTLGWVTVTSQATTTAPTVILENGVHDVSPPSADYVARGTLPTIRLSHSDPDGIDPQAKVWVYLQFAPGLYLDLIKLAGAAFETVQADGNNLVLDLDLGRLGFKGSEIDLWWVVQPPTGDLKADHARFRFAD